MGIAGDDDELVALVGQVIRLARHEAMLFGLDAPSKMELATGLIGPPIDKEEIDTRLARLTQQERDSFMMLIAKMDGRWVEPPAIASCSRKRKMPRASCWLTRRMTSCSRAHMGLLDRNVERCYGRCGQSHRAIKTRWWWTCPTRAASCPR